MAILKAWLLLHCQHPPGVWWAMTLSMILMCGLLANRFRGDAWVKASFDKESNSMLWEACVPRKPVV
ncbi:MAG: hypothetical protein RDU20_12260 [Desulfomonilaceae bacterium]|nr:hypothetical protein [Desulfomonilaceae bacterium]